MNYLQPVLTFLLKFPKAFLKKRAPISQQLSTSFPQLIQIADCMVSLKPMPEFLAEKLNPKDLKEYIYLLEQAQFYPHRHFDEILQFQKRHPDLPEAANLLAFVYIQKKEIQKAEDLICENYEKFPHYLFAKINYADQLLRKKMVDKIPEIFPGFNLKKLYPERKLFHYTEFRGFMVTLGFYHLALKNRKAAKSCLSNAKKVDPDHSSIKLLEKKLKMRFLLR